MYAISLTEAGRVAALDPLLLNGKESAMSERGSTMTELPVWVARALLEGEE